MERKGKSNFFGFDMPDSQFELLETEQGEPSFWGGWRESSPKAGKEPEERVDPDVETNCARIAARMRGDINPDLIRRRFLLGGNVQAMAVFLNGMADGDMINDFILRPGMRRWIPNGKEGSLAEYAMKSVFSMQEAELQTNLEDVMEAVEEGLTAVFIQGEHAAVVMDTRGYKSRSVGTPQNETVVLGPQEAFTENIRTNVTLLRRIIKTEDIVCEFRKSGGKNNNRVAILYREGVANPALVNEVKRRLASVDTLMVLSIGTLEQLTERHSFCPLPQSLTTERPDRAASFLMQGHVAVLLEGSPFANVMPATFFAIMSAGGDAYVRAPTGTIIRIVRYIGALLSMLMPAYFLALAMHHPGMLSGEVLSTVIASRSMVFLPLGVEMIFLLFVFQLVREAGVSVPGAMGQSVGIIGGLVLGQAAVSANIVSKVVLIIVALTGLGNFCIPDYSTQLTASYYRILLVLAAWAGGLLGLMCAVLLTCAYLANLKSYGVPYLSPVAPKTYAKGPVFTRGPVTNHTRPSDDMNTGRAGA